MSREKVSVDTGYIISKETRLQNAMFVGIYKTNEQYIT